MVSASKSRDSEGRESSARYTQALGASLGVHGAMFCVLLFGIPGFKPKPLIVEDAIMVDLVTPLEPAAPAVSAPPPPQPAQPPPPQPVPEPPPVKPPENAMPEPKKKDPPKEDPAKKKLQELRDRRKKDKDRVEKPQAPATPIAVADSRPPVPQPSPVTSQVPPVAGNPNSPGTATDGSVQARGVTFPYAWYLVEVKNRIWARWHPPMANAAILALVGMEIMRDGTVSPQSVQVIQSSGLQSFDQSCLTAVLECQLPPLPEGYPHQSLELNLIFRE